MFRDLPRLIELFERLVIAVEKIANAQEDRARVESASEEERFGEGPDERIRVRHVA